MKKHSASCFPPVIVLPAVALRSNQTVTRHEKPARFKETHRWQDHTRIIFFPSNAAPTIKDVSVRFGQAPVVSPVIHGGGPMGAQYRRPEVAKSRSTPVPVRKFSGCRQLWSALPCADRFSRPEATKLSTDRCGSGRATPTSKPSGPNWQVPGPRQTARNYWEKTCQAALREAAQR